jgi:hypothetical protein
VSIEPGQRARQISTMHEHDICDVCGRTLLRGERTEPFIDGARRYEVCELCKPRALHEGWLREGALPDYPSSGSAPARRGSLFGRFRRRTRDEITLRDPSDDLEPQVPQTLDDELLMGDWASGPQAPGPGSVSGSQSSPSRRARQRPQPPRPERGREPRRIHAVPTQADHKVAAAVDVFNGTSHTRTIAGVARSLGAPEVSITADPDRSAIVWAIAAWELCWYRYEVDLSDEGENVRLDSQGYELDELGPHERFVNATADEAGRLVLA